MPSTQQPPQEMLTSTPTRCIPIKASNKNNHLPSSAIRRSKLVNVTTIVQKYQNYCHPSRIAILARKLAEKCYFGPTALKQCTVSGYRGEPALPIKELNDLKTQIFTLLPQFWGNPVEFESIWTTCTVSIGQLCKTIRLNMKKQQ